VLEGGIFIPVNAHASLAYRWYHGDGIGNFVLGVRLGLGAGHRDWTTSILEVTNPKRGKGFTVSKD